MGYFRIKKSKSISRNNPWYNLLSDNCMQQSAHLLLKSVKNLSARISLINASRKIIPNESYDYLYERSLNGVY